MANTLQPIKLGITFEEALIQAGQPLRKSDEGNFTVLWYTSKVPGKSENLYFLNNTLYAKAWPAKEENTPLSTLISEYGSPTATYSLNPSETQDSLRQTMHVWPEQGAAVLTYGTTTQSIVQRRYELTSTSLDEYLKQWQVTDVQKKATTIAENPPSPIPARQAEYVTVEGTAKASPFTVESLKNIQLPILLGATAVIILGIGVTLLWWRKKKKARAVNTLAGNDTPMEPQA